MKKILKGLSYVLGSLLLIWFLLFLFPLSGENNYAFFDGIDDTLVIAHRGGKASTPENTLAAFQNATEVGADILEYDVHITADGQLVVIHDSTVDRTTNGTGKVNELTLEEVQALDAGYHFVNENGDYPFRGQGVTVPTVREVLEGFSDQKHLIELKDTNDSEMHAELVTETWRLIQEYDMEEKVLISSFDHDINLRFQEISNGEVPIGAGEEETRQFVVLHKALLNALYRTQATAFQLPTEREGYNLADWKLVRGADNRGMHVYYWTINEEETMRELIDLGTDGIITDDPALLIEVLSE